MRFLQPRHGIIGAVAGAVVGLLGAPALAFHAQQSPERTVDTGRGLIMGRVLDGDSDVPVAQARVSLGGAGLSRSVLTDDRGRYVFFDVPAGRYSLEAVLQGYCCGSFGRTNPFERSRAVVLTDGQMVPDAVLRLWKNGAIAGRVVDERGEAVVGVNVHALQVTSLAGRPYVRAGAAIAARTDDLGEFRLGDLALTSSWIVSVPAMALSVPIATPDGSRQAFPPGSAVAAELLRLGLAGVAPGTADTLASDTVVLQWIGAPPPAGPVGRQGFLAYRSQFHPDTTDLAQAERFDLKPGQVRSGLELRLRPQRMARIEGTLTAPTGPLPNVTVRLSQAFDPVSVSGMDVAITFTDRVGQFAFPAVPPGRYELLVFDIPGAKVGMFGGRGVNGVRTTMLSTDPFGDAPTLWARESITVSESAVSSVTVAVAEGRRISGRLHFRGRAAPPTGSALMRFSASVERVDGLPVAPVSVSGGNDSGNRSGRFRTIGLPAGKYFIRPDAPRGSGWWPASAEWRGRDVMFQPVELNDEDIVDVVVTFTDAPASVAGTVRTTRGEPSTSSVVAVFPADPAMWIDFGWSAPHFVLVNVADDGTFTVPSMPPGDYYAVATRADLRDDWRQPQVLRDLARTGTRISVRAGQRVQVSLTGGGD